MKTLLFLIVALLLPALATAEDWPQFRGPDGQGHSSETGLPVVWSEHENIAWKTQIRGTGWSSPVVAGKLVWLTSATEDTGSLWAIALDRESGAVVRQIEVFRKAELGRIAQKNSHASPTPILDGDRVFVHYGAHGTACIDATGKLRWRTRLPYDHRHGPAGSPVIWKNLVIVACDGADEQYLIALDKVTGKVHWKQKRVGDAAYSTPLLIRVGSVDQLVSVGGGAIAGYNPQNGVEVWRCRFEGESVVPRPVYAQGLIYFCTGCWTPSLYALRVDGRGDVTNTHVVGRVHRSVPLTSSPLVIDSNLFMVSDQGIMSCLDAQSGEEHWHKRLAGEFSASPVTAEGRIYLLDEDGTTSVVEASEKYHLLATNRLEGRSLASPAIAGKAIFLRTEQYLYKIEQKTPAVAKRSKSSSQPTAK